VVRTSFVEFFYQSKAMGLIEFFFGFSTTKKRKRKRKNKTNWVESTIEFTFLQNVKLEG